MGGTSTPDSNLLRRGAHAVAEAVLRQDLEHGLLPDVVALVHDELADALRPDLDEVQAPPSRPDCGARRGGARLLPAKAAGRSRQPRAEAASTAPRARRPTAMANSSGATEGCSGWRWSESVQTGA
ncbi:unnamed protein product, partial [Prorocentrum cordatum]